MPYNYWQARKIYSTQKSFYLQGILNDVTEQDTSFHDCKHKHMMKSGAPPDKGLISIFLEMVWVPLKPWNSIGHRRYKTPNVSGGAPL